MIIVKKKIITYLFIITLALYCNLSFAQNQIEVGVDEQLGSYLPMDLPFVTSNGDTVILGNIIDKPVLLAFVYYECPGICSPMLNELAWTVDKIQLEPGADFKVITLSFDHHETPAVAAKWKRNYLQSMKRKIDENDWTFLVGDSLNISQITKSAGFYFKPSDDGEFIHAGTLIAISPDGKITRYLFGTKYNPFDVKMAMIEAKAGKTSPTISKVLEFCYSYDPDGRTYTLNVTRIIGVVMLLGVGIFLTVLLFKKKSNKNTELS
jgi:protein SCO1/2